MTALRSADRVRPRADGLDRTGRLLETLNRVRPRADGLDRTGRLLETLNRAAAIMRRAGIPFAVAGECAAFARGGGPPAEDVDLVVLESDIGKAAAAMDVGGMQVENPPEDWLIRAHDGDQAIDLIFKLPDRPVSGEIIARAEEFGIAATHVPVMDATDLVLSWLLSFSEHRADFAAMLARVSPLREQVDWHRVRSEAASSPFGCAFLVLLERLGVIAAAGVNGAHRGKRRRFGRPLSQCADPGRPEAAVVS